MDITQKLVDIHAEDDSDSKHVIKLPHSARYKATLRLHALVEVLYEGLVAALWPVDVFVRLHQGPEAPCPTLALERHFALFCIARSRQHCLAGSHVVKDNHTRRLPWQW